MSSEKVYIELEVTGDKAVVTAVDKVNRALDGVNTHGKEAEKGLTSMERAMAKATTIGTFLGNAVYDLASRLASSLVGAIGQAIASAAKMQTTLAGLSGVAQAFGIGADKAKEAALRLSKDGLMKVDEAAAGLKNLLATGFSLPESIQLMQVFKDSAAFGAQGFYSVGQASVRATEGIKFGNSALTDSTGLGKNLSVIMREAGLSETMAGQAASNHAVRRAILNGFIKEGALFTGQAEMKSKTFAGQQERLSNTYDMLLASIGSYIVENKSVVALLSTVSTKLAELMGWLAEAGRGYDFVTTAIVWLLKAMDKMLWAVDMANRAWAFLQDGLNGVVAAFFEAGKGIVGFQLDMLKAVAAVPGATTVLGGLDDGIKTLQSTYDLASSAAYNYGKASDDAAKTWKEGTPLINSMRSGLNDMTKSVEAARGQTVELGTQQQRTNKTTEDQGKKSKEAATQVGELAKKTADLARDIKEAEKRGASGSEILKQFGQRAQNVAEEAKFLRVNLNGAAAAIKALADQAAMVERSKFFRETLAEANAAMKDQFNKLVGQMGEAGRASIVAITDAVQSNNKIVAAAQQQMTDMEMQRIMSAARYETYQLEQRRNAEIESLNKSDANWQTHADKIRAAYDVMIAEVIRKNSQAAQSTNSWAGALANVAQYIAQIAEASDSPTLKNLSGIMGTFGIAAKAQQEFGRTNEDGTFTAAKWGIGSALKNADGSMNWTNVGAAGAGLATGAMNVWGATDVAGRGNRAMAGAKAGAAAGAMFGPYGALIGMGVGALVGALRNPGFEQEMKRIANDFGVNISEKLAREIDKLKKSFGGDRQAAEIFSLDKIIAEAGGITDKNVDKLTARFRDIFVMVEVGKFTAEQAKAVVEKSFPAFASYMEKSTKVASKAFVELLDLSKRFGLESGEVLKFVEGQTGRLGDALSALILPTVTTKEEIQDLGVIAYGAFARATEMGMGQVAAMDAMGEALDKLVAKQQELGVTVEDESVSWLLAYRDKVQANRDLVNATEALNDTMLATSNIGALNQQTFDAMQRQGQRTYDRLIAAGFTENESLSLMRKYLEQVINARDEYGLQLDDNTKKLLAQAEANGIVKTSQETLNDIMKTGLSAIIELLGGKLPEAWEKAGKAAQDGAGKTTDGLTEAARKAKELADAARDAGDAVRGIGTPDAGSGGDYTAHTGGMMGKGKVIYRYHWGGQAGMKPDEYPAILQSGEGVLNRRAMKALGVDGLRSLNRGGMVTGGGGDSIVVNAPVTVEGNVMDQQTVERLAQQVGDVIARKVRKRRVA